MYRFICEHKDHASRPAVQRIELEISDDSDMDELVDAFKRFCLAVGYSPNNVREIYYGVPDSIPYEEEEETPRTLTEFTDRDIFGEDRTHASDK